MVTDGEAMAIAGVLARPRVGRADQWQEQRGGQHRRPGLVVLAQVAQLVPDVEIQRVGPILHAVDHVRQQHHETAAEEFRRERIQHAVAVDQIGLGHRHPQFRRALLQARMQIRELARIDGNGIAPQMRYQGGMGDQRKQRERQQIQQRDTKGAEYQHQPDDNGQHERNDAQRRLVPVDEFVHRIFPCFGASPTRHRSLPNPQQ